MDEGTNRRKTDVNDVIHEINRVKGLVNDELKNELRIIKSTFNTYLADMHITQKPIAGADQEALLRGRLWKVVDMAGKIKSLVNNGSDMELCEHAIDGAINGACIEILRFLGHEPCFENLRRHSRD